MNFEEDPEVAADRQLQAATLRDPTRSREMPKWTPPVIVAKVPCRRRCGSVVEWTEEAEHAFQVWNRRLSSQNEAPLDKTRILLCETCTRFLRKLDAQDNRSSVENLSVMVRKLKEAEDPDRDVHLIADIRAAHHSDVEGLLQSLRDKNKSASKTRRASI